MELIKASVGGGSSHITLALLLAASFFLAAAYSAHSTATTDPAHEHSVLKLPTEAGSTDLEDEQACCDQCGLCTRSLPPICNCRDVFEECPSWCSICVPVFGGGKTCLDVKPNYCKNNCNRRKAICCDQCGPCTKSIPPQCFCADVAPECPSWCDKCMDVGNGMMCTDLKPNYCEKTCAQN